MGARDGAKGQAIGRAVAHQPVRAERGNAARNPLVTNRTTNDVDEQAALLDNWNQTYNQLSSVLS